MNNKSKSRKAPPPIVFILLGLIIFGGISLVKKNHQPISNLLPSIDQFQSLEKRFSLGEYLLIPANATNEKKEGINAFAVRDYQGAAKLFQASLKQFPNDPETLIYLNNATVATLNRVKIAVVAPIGSDLNLAQEMLRGVAQAQDKFNSQDGNLQVEIVNDQNKPEIAKQVAAVPWHIEGNTNPDFIQAANSLWKGKVNWRTAMAYDATQALIAGIKANPSRQGIQQTLSKADFSITGASGTIKFLPSGDRNQAVDLVKVEVDSNSEFGYSFVPVN